MARPLTWNELQPGMDVWEDCLLGSGTVHKRVVKRNGDRVWLEQNGAYSLAIRTNANHRYWDAEPTTQERDRTPWRALYE